MPSDRLTLDPVTESASNAPLELNDGDSLFLLEHAYPTPDDQRQYAGSVSTEGDAIAASRPGNRTITIKTRVREPGDVAGSNLMPAPSAEGGAAGWSVASSYMLNTGGAVTASKDSLFGDYSLAVNADGTAAKQGTTFTFTAASLGLANFAAGTAYTFSVFLKRLTGSTTLTINLGDLSADNAASTPTVTTSFARYAVTWTPTANRAAATVCISTPFGSPTASSWLADGFMVNVGSAPLSYFDGDTPGCYWTGTRHASSSVRNGSGGDRFAGILSDLQKKVAKLNSEGGTLRRITSAGDVVTYDVLAAKIDVPTDKRALVMRSCEATITLECKPYGRGPEQSVGYVSDDFSTDTIASGLWAFDSGTGTLSASGGQLIPSTTAQKVLARSDFAYTDQRATIKVTTGASGAGSESLIVLKRLSAGNYLLAGVTGTTLGIYTVIGGAATSKATGAATLSAATNYWVQARIEDNTVTVSYFTVAPVAGTTPTGTLSYTLAGSDATTFGTGITGSPGLRLMPVATDWRYDDFKAEAFFETVDPALVFTVSNVKGDVPALGRLVVNEDQAYYQGLLLWGQESKTFTVGSSLVAQGESGLIGGGFGIAAYSDASASGGTCSRYTAGSSSTDVIVSGPVVAGTHRGVYRVFARVRVSNAAQLIRAQWGLDPILRGPTSNANQKLSAPNQWELVDLGLVNVGPNTSTTWTMYVLGKTVSGATIDVDFVILQPVAEGAGRASGTFTLGNSEQVVVTSESAYAVTSSNAYAALTKYEGDYLRIAPSGREGRKTRFLVKAGRGAPGDGTPDGIDDISARLYYVPRYLVGPEPN